MTSPRAGGPVPFLPGNSVHDVTKTHHPKMQTLSISNCGGLKDSAKLTQPLKLDLESIQNMGHISHRYDYTKVAQTHDERTALKDSARNTYRPAIAPAWLKHDRQVLRFNAYFQEPVHESPNENFRIRNCVILYYLEDGTMHILEPKVENSGIPQGAFLKRHRVPKPEGGYYAPADLRCGAEIIVYAKRFRIVDADEFTQWFFANAAFLDLGAKEQLPDDAFSAVQKANSARPIAAGGSISARLSSAVEPGVQRAVAEGKEFAELSLGGNRKNAKLQQFLENDRKVLCFNCYWDDPTRYGSRQYYTLHYFLADDTVEILECQGRNSGRDPYPVLNKRAQLRKNPYSIPVPGMMVPDALLYKPEDLVVGQHIEVFGREIFFYDCDDFTRQFYREWLNVEQPSFEIQETQQEHITLGHPPHTGIGSEEDSIENCKNLYPKPPKKDIGKIMGMREKVLRFEAALSDPKPEETQRRFVITVYMCDNTVGVWEISQRNSGFLGGKFAERSKKRSPSGDWFVPRDFSVGASVTINAVSFKILSVDDASLKIMDEFSLS